MMTVEVLNEVLNETVCALDKCPGLTVLSTWQGIQVRGLFGQEIYSPFLLAFSEQDDKWTNFPTPTFSAMDPSYSLPENVAILTLQELEDGAVLLRLAHLYEVGEDKDLSSLATVELKRVFSNRKINKIKEMSLSANQERSEMERKRLSWKVEGSSTKAGTADSRGGPVDPAKLVVELAPMELRTFILDFDTNLIQFSDHARTR